jgi:hypothetical protein
VGEEEREGPVWDLEVAAEGQSGRVTGQTWAPRAPAVRARTQGDSCFRTEQPSGPVEAAGIRLLLGSEEREGWALWAGAEVSGMTIAVCGNRCVNVCNTHTHTHTRTRTPAPNFCTVRTALPTPRT